MHAPPAHPKSRPSEHKRWLVTIGALKLIKGAFFVAVGFGLLKMLHHDVYMVALRVVEALRFDPDRLAIAKFLEETSLVNDHRLKQLSALTFAYAALDFIEGTGLVLRKRWAEYFTLILTTAFLPLEAIHLIHHPSRWTLLVALLNVAVVAYLAWLVPAQRHASAPRPSAQH